MIDSADQKWTFVFYLTEDGSALVACFRTAVERAITAVGER
jgi:hypothetical protein